MLKNAPNTKSSSDSEQIKPLKKRRQCSYESSCYYPRSHNNMWSGLTRSGNSLSPATFLNRIRPLKIATDRWQWRTEGRRLPRAYYVPRTVKMLLMFWIFYRRVLFYLYRRMSGFLVIFEILFLITKIWISNRLHLLVVSKYIIFYDLNTFGVMYPFFSSALRI